MTEATTHTAPAIAATAVAICAAPNLARMQERFGPLSAFSLGNSPLTPRMGKVLLEMAHEIDQPTFDTAVSTLLLMALRDGMQLAGCYDELLGNDRATQGLLGHCDQIATAMSEMAEAWLNHQIGQLHLPPDDLMGVLCEPVPAFDFEVEIKGSVRHG